MMINVLFLLFLFVYAEGKAHGRESTAFFVQAVHNPRTAVYVASQFARKISVDGCPINTNCQVIHVIIPCFSYYFYLFMMHEKVVINFNLALTSFCKSQWHSLFRQSTIHGRPCTWLHNLPGQFPWKAAPSTVRLYHVMIHESFLLSLFVYAAGAGKAKRTLRLSWPCTRLYASKVGDV